MTLVTERQRETFKTLFGLQPELTDPTLTLVTVSRVGPYAQFRNSGRQFASMVVDFSKTPEDLMIVKRERSYIPGPNRDKLTGFEYPQGEACIRWSLISTGSDTFEDKVFVEFFINSKHSDPIAQFTYQRGEDFPTSREISLETPDGIRAGAENNPSFTPSIIFERDPTVQSAQVYNVYEDLLAQPPKQIGTFAPWDESFVYEEQHFIFYIDGEQLVAKRVPIKGGKIWEFKLPGVGSDQWLTLKNASKGSFRDFILLPRLLPASFQETNTK